MKTKTQKISFANQLRMIAYPMRCEGDKAIIKVAANLIEANHMAFEAIRYNAQAMNRAEPHRVFSAIESMAENAKKSIELAS